MIYDQFTRKRSSLSWPRKDLIGFNCRDHSAMVLQTFNPSKAMDGLNELEYINRFPLVIREIQRSKATLGKLFFGSFLLAAHLIRGSYIIIVVSHFFVKNKMTENRDIDFLGDHSLPGITCFHDPITPRKGDNILLRTFFQILIQVSLMDHCQSATGYFLSLDGHWPFFWVSSFKIIVDS